MKFKKKNKQKNLAKKIRRISKKYKAKRSYKFFLDLFNHINISGVIKLNN